MKDYFNKNKITIFKNIINNFDDVIEKKFITIYIPVIILEHKGYSLERDMVNLGPKENLIESSPCKSI